MRTIAALALTVFAVGLMAGCAPAADEPGDAPASDAPEPPSTSATPSSTDLPTLTPPTAPPTNPTDAIPNGTVAGRVSGLGDSCVEVTTDDGTVWSLTGEVDGDIAVGDTVLVKVEALPVGEALCGSGAPARIVSISLVD
ncbi:hypothetical protein [Agromyces allii]|uniref:DUF5666 domain-containing protein n=1 Tax=Agromyces allii TaxID=393607 RepID=A0ABN2QNL4_9MICO|nr:hypothetical protein [Agromyces allii]